MQTVIARSRVTVARIQHYVKYLAIAATAVAIRAGEFEALAAIRVVIDTNLNDIGCGAI